MRTFDFASQVFILELLDVAPKEALSVVMTEKVTIVDIVRIGSQFLGGGGPNSPKVRHLSPN